MARAEGRGPGGFFEELKRRRVVRAVVAYAAIAFLVMQGAELVVPGLGLPEWTFRVVVVVAVLGIPVVAVLSWVFDWTPAGVKRTDPSLAAGGEAGRSSALDEIDGTRRRRSTTVGRLALGLLAIAVVVVGGWRLLGPRVALADMAAVAVLPLDNLSADPDDAFFALGLTDEILTQLHNVSALRVTSRTSVMPYIDSDKDLRTIADELGVRYVIEGSAQALGDQVRINLQLIDATTDSHLWADTFERSKSDLFAVQAEIAARVARSVHVRLKPEEQLRLAVQPTQSAEAYAWFLRARAHALDGLRAGPTTGRGEAWRLATDAYRRAIEIDPDYALAHAELAMHLERSMWLGVDPTAENRRLALTSLERAEALAPDAPTTRLARATRTYFFDRLWASAADQLEELEAVMPADHEHLFLLGGAYRRLARFADAVDTWERALALDPLDGQLYLEIHNTNLRLRRYAEAEDVYRRAAAAGLADPRDLRLDLAAYARGDISDARRILRELVDERGVDALINDQWWVTFYSRDFEGAVAVTEHAPSGRWQTTLSRIIPLLMMGDGTRARSEAEPWIPELERRLEDRPSGWNRHQDLAVAYIGAGREDAAVGLLREYLDHTWVEADHGDPDLWAGLNRFKYEASRVFALAGAWEDAFRQLEMLLEMEEYPYLRGVTLRVSPAWDAVRAHPRFQRIQARADSIDVALGWDPTPRWTGSP